MKATVQLLLYTIREKNSGKYPVKLRVIHSREKHDYRTGIDMAKEEFEQAISPKPGKLFREQAEVLLRTKNRALEIVNSLEHFTFSKFEAELYQQKKDASDIFPFFDEYIGSLQNQDRVKTAISYQTARNIFKAFYSKPKLNIYDITPEFLNRFSKWMIDAGKSSTTVGIYTRTLRVIYNYAISKGVVKHDEHYPFGRTRFSIPASRNVKKALSTDEIRLIFTYQADPMSYEDRSKDFWIFSYLCNGINFKDIAHLKWKNLDGDMLRFVREKTKRTTQSNQRIITCHVTEQAMKIIEKWGNKQRASDTYIFPILEVGDTAQKAMEKVAQFIQTTNKNMKRICLKVGIEKNVTTYHGRHSAATILKKSGATIEQIQELLGHTSSNTTRAYLDSFDDDTKRDLSKFLIQGI
jgi:integrase